MEIQSRSPFSHLLTPQSCRRRYRDLKLRFAGPGGEEGRHEDDEGEEAGSSVEVPWVEELRKLRVAELRREVERYDASIGYLQLKVKRLEEERERSLRETESVEEKPDQEKEADISASHTPEVAVGDAISGKDSGRSCGESNSTLPKEGEKKLDGDDGKAEEAVGTGGESADPVERLPAGESGESMVAESKGEEEEEEEEEEGEGEKEGSDVQCSRSPSRRRRGRRRRLIPGGSNSREEGDADADADADAGAAEESIIMGKRVAAESEPLMMFLETIRSDQQVSILERRLGCQESVSYRSLIRRHVDLEMVRAKVDGLGQGGGSYTTAEFLLDLLLLCTNVIVFHPKDSPESIAAARLRDKVIKEISACVGPPTPSSRLPIEPTPPPTPDLDVTDSLPDKPTTAAPLIACRTRSSTSNMSEEVEEEKEETPKTEPEESVNEEKALEKKMNKETYVLSRKTRGLRTNKLRSGHAGDGPTAKRPSVAAVPNLKPRAAQNAAVVDAATTSHRKSDGSVASTAALEKQKRQDNSPNQIKRSSKGTVKETLKSSSSRGGGVGGKAVEIQMKRGKSNGGKDQRTRQGTGAIRVESATKKVADTSGPAKRSVGRPPKRAASPSTLLRPGKRARGHTEARATPGSRKRGRK
ncbi:hypothetical protein OPV22_032046 [Ensete ventricosum]|uniref:Bromo domain-containing protein n=1 Tax=Ensete ventricosum TaxID=4639 RepID=A0AAV8PWB1_ENSVE|nr:hypothetical protein OPV22_032046 [Ensete ventricosum]